MTIVEYAYMNYINPPSAEIDVSDASSLLLN